MFQAACDNFEVFKCAYYMSSCFGLTDGMWQIGIQVPWNADDLKDRVCAVAKGRSPVDGAIDSVLNPVLRMLTNEIEGGEDEGRRLSWHSTATPRTIGAATP